jgi:hypothetical protein
VASARDPVFLPTDDFDQAHALDGREKMNSDEIIRRVLASASPVIGRVEVLEPNIILSP